jgi:hypothetical protein
MVAPSSPKTDLKNFPFMKSFVCVTDPLIPRAANRSYPARFLGREKRRPLEFFVYSLQAFPEEIDAALRASTINSVAASVGS